MQRMTLEDREEAVYVRSLLDAVHSSFDRTLLLEQLSRLQGEDVCAVTAALGMQDVIRSYRVGLVAGDACRLKSWGMYSRGLQ